MTKTQRKPIAGDITTALKLIKQAGVPFEDRFLLQRDYAAAVYKIERAIICLERAKFKIQTTT